MPNSDSEELRAELLSLLDKQLEVMELSGYVTLAEDIRTKYGLTSLKAGGSCLALTAINEALEAAAEIADRSHAPEIANEIRALKWEAKMPSYASEIQTERDVA